MAAHVKFAALLLAAALLAAACSGGGSTEPTPSPSATPPTESESPSNIDVTEWRSYVSPIGFELRYPPDWTLDIVSDSQMRILSPAYKQTLDDAITAGELDVGLPPIPGASQFSVIANISAGFDVDQLIGSCGTQALRTTLAGRSAIRCPGTGTVTDTLRSAGQSYWVEFPPGHTMLVGGSVISEGAPDLAVVEAILSTFNFTQAETPPIDTSAWPTFSSPLGFDIQYPPTWLAKDLEAPNMVRFLNEKAQAEHTRREAEGISEFDSYEAGEAWVEISPGPDRPFDVDSLSSNCAGTSSTTQLVGRPAVRCGGLFWVETPSGTIVQVIRAAIEADLQTHRLLDAALATITFHE